MALIPKQTNGGPGKKSWGRRGGKLNRNLHHQEQWQHYKSRGSYLKEDIGVWGKAK